MFYERVNFNEEEVKKMSREDFESRHINLFWLDRDEATRKKMLGEVYDIIHKPAKQTKQKADK